MAYLFDGTAVTIGNYLAALAIGDYAKAIAIYRLLTDLAENEQELERLAQLKKKLGLSDDSPERD